MKYLLFFFLLQLISIQLLFSQNNIIKGFVIGLPTPVSLNATYSLGYERFIKENKSIELYYNGYMIISEGSGSSNSLRLGYRMYKDGKKKSINKLWVAPYLGSLYLFSGDDMGSEKFMYYHLGCTIGKRLFMKNDKFFWDFGGGFSYGMIKYLSYYYDNLYDEIAPETSHENEFQLLPRLFINFGINY